MKASLLAFAALFHSAAHLVRAANPADCLVNREVIASWEEANMKRWRIHVTAEGWLAGTKTNPNDGQPRYCEKFSRHAPGNIQCYILEGVGHVVDVSYSIVTDDHFWYVYEATLGDWMADNGCRTGNRDELNDPLYPVKLKCDQGQVVRYVPGETPAWRCGEPW